MRGSYEHWLETAVIATVAFEPGTRCVAVVSSLCSGCDRTLTELPRVASICAQLKIRTFPKQVIQQINDGPPAVDESSHMFSHLVSCDGVCLCHSGTLKMNFTE